MTEQLKSFSLDQLGLFVGTVIGALALLIKAIQHSKCKKIECCGCKIDREVDVVDDNSSAASDSPRDIDLPQMTRV